MFSNNKPKILKDIIHQTSSVSDNLVLVASQNLGLIAFEDGSFTGKHIPLKISGKKSIDNYDAIAIQEDKKKGNYWIYVQNIGICSYSYKSRGLKVVFPLSIGGVKAMEFSADGNLWFGSDEGLFLFNIKTGVLSENYFSNKCSVSDILLDKKKNFG